MKVWVHWKGKWFPFYEYYFHQKKKVFIQSLGTVFQLCNLLWEIFPVISQNNIHTSLVISMAFQYVQLYG